jgi:hypothetical protein
MGRLLLVVGSAVALSATSSMAGGVPVATRCSGSVKVGSVLAGSIRTTKVSCTKGKAVIRSLLGKAAAEAFPDVPLLFNSRPGPRLSSVSSDTNAPFRRLPECRRETRAGGQIPGPQSLICNA